ncbi:MAG: T9SS type A sorting domain-containing protein [Candidatus Marinimicrobia bacterium]|jgi:hypothetical protein|nr:T9SS type A sorting domain-containing protein [Candidatus Neomarinimicrobiota bacterium]MBT5270519.1 T9SS type A sorting domain-containing protein [Candidatus Neomarinimicrobiota bacterium]
MRGLILSLLTVSGLFAQTIHITGNYLDLLDNPIDSARVYYRQDFVVVDSTLTSASGAFDLQFTIVSVNPVLPSAFSLGQNYPNPFNPSTRIDLAIQEPGSFSIYDIRGALVESIDLPSAGSYELTWGGRNLDAGLYIYVLRSGKQASSRKMILLDGGDGSGLTASQVSFSSPNSLSKPASNDAIRFERHNTTPLEIDFITPQVDTSMGVINGNVGPRQIETIRDTVMYEGDTLSLDWNDYFYNDSETYYPPQFVEFMYLTDTTFYDTRVVAIDVLDTSLVTVSNTFRMTWLPVNNPPVLLLSPPDTSILEDEILSIDLSPLFHDEDSELEYSLSGLSNAVYTVDSLGVLTITPDLNWNGEIGGVAIIASDGEYTVESDPFTMIVTPVNDAPVFSGYIEGVTFPSDEFDPSYVVTISNHFSDPDGDDLTISMNLIMGYWSYEAGDMYIFAVPGDTLDVVITADDGELSVSSNQFPVIALEEVILPPDTFSVHFVMKDFKTDATLDSDTCSWWVDSTVYYTTDGTLDLQLAEGQAYDFNATHPQTVDDWNFNGDLLWWPKFTFLRRQGEQENFDQFDSRDSVLQVSVTGIDTILVYKIMRDFDLAGVSSYLNDSGNGTVRFRPDDLNAYAWLDTSGTHIVPHPTIRSDIIDLLEIKLPEITYGKLQLQYVESEIDPSPGQPRLYMYIDASVPGSGTNSTLFDENNNIILAQARWPSPPNPGQSDIFIEILQAVADLPDHAGSNPPVITYVSGVGYVINDFGEDIFMLDYFVNPGTYLRYYWNYD